MQPINKLTAAFWEAMKPPPKLSLSEWADRYAFLSAESSAETGRWKTLSYQKGIMDAVTDPTLEQITVMKSARVGYTKILNWAIAYHISQDVCSILLVQPTIEDAEGYSKEEIAPMLRDTPALAGLVSDAKAKDGSNTILHKIYPGGTLSMIGANSPRGFRRISRRLVAFDEVDGFPPATSEGDQIKLGIKRSEYFWNRKIIAGSTPTTKDASRIEKLFSQSDQRRFFVPCPRCGEFQYLKWANMKWTDDDPKTAHFVCEKNGCRIEHSDKIEMLERGEWRATAPGNGKHAGFHIWAAYSYSPNASWSLLVEEFLDAKADVEQLKTFVNVTLGELWEDEYSAKVGATDLQARAETYEPGVVPAGALTLVAGVDVQDNRFAVTVMGYGRGEESWIVSHTEIYGDPALPEIWKQLDDLLFRPWRHESGAEMEIAAVGIDTGGHFTHESYQWARARKSKKVLALKGSSQRGKPAIGKPTKQDVNFRGQVLKWGVNLYPVGTDTIKSLLYARLKLGQIGQGYLHFHAALPPEYFEQLTAEKKITRYVKGFPVQEWVKKPGARNEALDCAVYAYASLQWLYTQYNRATVWDQLERELGENGGRVTPAVSATEIKPEPVPENKPAPVNTELKKQNPARTISKRRPGSFVSRW